MSPEYKLALVGMAILVIDVLSLIRLLMGVSKESQALDVGRVINRVVSEDGIPIARKYCTPGLESNFTESDGLALTPLTSLKVNRILNWVINIKLVIVGMVLGTVLRSSSGDMLILDEIENSILVSSVLITFVASLLIHMEQRRYKRTNTSYVVNPLRYTKVMFRIAVVGFMYYLLLIN